jgi:hypothetical protein
MVAFCSVREFAKLLSSALQVREAFRRWGETKLDFVLEIGYKKALINDFRNVSYLRLAFPDPPERGLESEKARVASGSGRSSQAAMVVARFR